MPDGFHDFDGKHVLLSQRFENILQQDLLAAIVLVGKHRNTLLRQLLHEYTVHGRARGTGFEAAALAARMADFPHTALKGLMAIPPVSEFPGENCRYFAEMRNLFVDIRAKKYDNVSMECLSMGMSDDFADAIAEGSTMVRIGTAIFGKRNYNI